jgi:hypothetical protein
MLQLSKYSFGVGDRFAHQAKAQLKACMLIGDQGVEVVPVWNKSNREHTFIGSEPSSVRAAADEAVRTLGWTHPYHVDADHINLDTVERFLGPSDFFTIDVAHFIGKPPAATDLDTFVRAHPELMSRIAIPGIETALPGSRDALREIASKFLTAAQEAGRIYGYIADRKGAGNFITEVSMDETDVPQTPLELLVILAALAGERIPLQTIAPKFTGRFNKGIDYRGDVAQFTREFSEDLAVIAYAIERYELPGNLKLSVHSGSDKFSIYRPIREAVTARHAGLHVKTAGTSWLEELIGLAEAGGDALALVQEIYAKAYEYREALCEPYAAVIDIDFARLPSPAQVAAWSSADLTSALRHDPTCPGFDPNVRQLLHVGFKLAAKMGDRYLRMLEQCEKTVSRNVTENLFVRHLKPLFLV